MTLSQQLREADAAIAAMRGEPVRKYALGDRLTKTKGSAWTGRVVGFYSTSLTPVGYAIESENEPGSVQIYPESALEPDAIRREPKAWEYIQNNGTGRIVLECRMPDPSIVTGKNWTETALYTGPTPPDSGKD